MLEGYTINLNIATNCCLSQQTDLWWLCRYCTWFACRSFAVGRLQLVYEMHLSFNLCSCLKSCWWNTARGGLFVGELPIAFLALRGTEEGERREYPRRGTSRRWVKDPDSLSLPSARVRGGVGGGGVRRRVGADYRRENSKRVVQSVIGGS
jgi:hypothetical protein